MNQTLDVPPGLDGVVAVATSVGDVLGDEGRFHYRGHDAVELARHHTVEEVRALLLDGSLPSRSTAPIDGAPAPVNRPFASSPPKSTGAW